jgi:hypothetical protein
MHEPLRSLHGHLLTRCLHGRCEGEIAGQPATQEEIMAQYLHNALAAAVAFGAGSLMLAVAFV